MVKITKKGQEMAKKWITDNGACSFDFKNGDVILPDGGLFSIEEKKIRHHKIKGFKNSQMDIFKRFLAKRSTSLRRGM